MSEIIVPRVKKLLHGGDYNPEQWPQETWGEDMRLMGPVRFDVATVGVFSWSKLQPSEDRFEFGWLDDVMDMLDREGRFAALATPSAAMPAWLSKQHPEVLRASADGGRMRHGRRVNFCWTSPVYRDATRQISTELAARYGNHPALAFWHVSNEYGGKCHCNLCQDAFREWLKRKFAGNLDALNAAYWTTYWSHVYTEWDQIEIPNGPYGEDAIMGLSLDWRRFCSDQVVDFFLNESAPLRALSPGVPVTTNFMGFFPDIDYPKFAKHLDFASWDSYPYFIDHVMEVRDWAKVSMAHDLNRSLKKKPFLLIESTPDSSNYYPVMMLKRPGVHALEGAQAIAHGSEGVMYFQWRKCRGSSEQYHGAVIGHDGTDQTRVYDEVRAMGETLHEWAKIRGSKTEARVAIIYDWENAWAIEGSFGPREQNKDYFATVLDHYQALWSAGISVDIVTSESDFSGYALVVAPMLYLLKPGVSDAIRSYVADGGNFVTTYWSAMVDENCLNFQGGFPGTLRDVFGIWAEETDCLYDGHPVEIKSVRENSLGLEGSFEARHFCDQISLEGAEALAAYASEFYAGKPCLTRHDFGNGQAFYVGSRNDASFQRAFLLLVAKGSGVEPSVQAQLPEGVTAQRRTDGENEYLFLLNCTPRPQVVDLPKHGKVSLVGYGHQLLVTSLASAIAEPAFQR